MWHSSNVIQRAINNTWFCLIKTPNMDYATTWVSVHSPLIHMVKHISTMCQLSQITHVKTQMPKESSPYSYSTEDCCSIKISSCSWICPSSDRPSWHHKHVHVKLCMTGWHTNMLFHFTSHMVNWNWPRADYRIDLVGNN